MPCVFIIYLYYTSKINIIHSFNSLVVDLTLSLNYSTIDKRKYTSIYMQAIF